MNWILERTYSVCNNVRDHSIEPVSFKKLIGRLRREFLNHDFDVTVTVKKEKFLAESEFYVMAYYDSDADRDNETSIEIVLHHNFLKDKQFGSVQKTEIITEIFDAIKNMPIQIKINNSFLSDIFPIFTLIN